MYISAAVKWTPEVEKHLRDLADQGALGTGGAELIGQIIGARAAGKTPADVAQKANLSLRTVRQLDSELGGQKAPHARPKFASVFISYGGPDEMFARKLYTALRDEGVEVFFFPESATPGQRLHRTMSDAVHNYDRILFICSRASLVRPGVLNELEQVLAREAREGGTELLMPVLIDDFVLREWSPERADLARQVRDRVAADFRSASSDVEFRKPLERVLGALSNETG